LKNYPQRDEKDYGNKENYIYYDYQGWRKDNFSLINFSRRIMELEREIQMEIEKSEKALENLSIVKEWREKILKEIVKQKNREIQQLQEQINQLQSQLTKIRSQNLQTQMEINC
jgi:chromosome segregation ATPase